MMKMIDVLNWGKNRYFMTRVLFKNAGDAVNAKLREEFIGKYTPGNIIFHNVRENLIDIYGHKRFDWALSP